MLPNRNAASPQHFASTFACEKFGVFSNTHRSRLLFLQRVDGSTREGSASIDARNWHQKFQSPWLSHAYGCPFGALLREVLRNGAVRKMRPDLVSLWEAVTEIVHCT